jgi:hypothetical protein
VEADLLLCDHAEAVNGKLYINGGGWSLLFAPGVPIAIYLAILVTVEWHETNVKHQLVAELRTVDGEFVENGDPPQPVRIGAELEMGRPPGIKPGTQLNAPIALGFGGLALAEGGYVWHLKLGEQELARRPFQVVPPPRLPGFPPRMQQGQR